MIITKKFMPRRTFLRGMGATMALPLLEAMVPAATPLAKTAANPVRRLGFVFMPMGCDITRWTPPGTNLEQPDAPDVLQRRYNFFDFAVEIGAFDQGGCSELVCH
jgi:hypothetical protein